MSGANDLRPRVLLINDEATWLGEAADWLTQRGYGVCSARSIDQAATHLTVTGTDIIVLHVGNRTADPWDFLVRATCDHGARVILISDMQALPFVVSALRQGRAADFLDAPAPRMAALRHAIDQAWHDGQTATAPDVDGLPAMTPREQDLVECLALGMDNKAIATRLAISDKTVRNMLTGLYSKLGVTSRIQAVIHLQKTGITPF